MSSMVKPRGEKWEQRFAFFKEHGAPNAPGFKQALKALPRWSDKLRVNFNVWAFFFGAIALFAFGLWKKAIVWLLIAIALQVLCALAPDWLAPRLQFGASIGCSMMAGLVCNYAYYQKERLQRQSWNLFEGMRF